MAGVLKNWRILASIFFSVALVVGAYVMASGFGAPTVVEASTETALLQAIATKDSDNDGLPDWEEALYGTDPHNPDTFHLGMSDGEAVAKGLIVPKAIADIPVATSTPANTSPDYAAEGLPSPSEGTLTDAFAKSFFTLYVAAKENNGGADLSSDDTQSIADQALSSLTSSVTATPDFKSAADIKVSGTGPDALRSYAIAAEAVLQQNAIKSTSSEMGYLQQAVQGGDETALTSLSALAKEYRDTATGLAELEVPSELATIHLGIVNALMRLSEIDDDFSRVDTDPLSTMLALEQFPETELDAEHAFTALANTYAAEGIVLPNGTPGAAFVNIMANIPAQQATSTPDTTP